MDGWAKKMLELTHVVLPLRLWLRIGRSSSRREDDSDNNGAVDTDSGAARSLTARYRAAGHHGDGDAPADAKLLSWGIFASSPPAA